MTRPCGILLLLLLLLATASLRAGTPVPQVTPVPEEVRKAWQLDDFYQKHVDAGGFPVISSGDVSDYALREAAYLVEKMLRGREDIRQALIRSRTRFVVMGYQELTTQIPEHSDLTPGRFWDRRARGLGATPERPAVSCGEENLVKLPGDPYDTENILIHEFAHAIHHMALNQIDKTFDARLESVFEAAIKKGLWKDKYASTNHAEYWAEGVQSWFNTNRAPDHDHNHVNTRRELKQYDPGLATLVAEIFPDDGWRYTVPGRRRREAHLRGLRPARIGSFSWPEELERWYRDNYPSN
jgi:hypothetical protein